MPEKFIVKFENFSKLVRVENFSDIREAVATSFSSMPGFTQDFTIGYRDKSFPLEYVMLDDPEDLHDREDNTLQIFRLSNLNSCSPPAVAKPNTPQPSPPQPRPPPPISEVEMNVLPTFEQQNNGALPSWPYPFVITDDMVRSSLIQKLDAGVKMDDGDRRILFSGLYDECTRLMGSDPYPSSRRYSAMVEAILRRWSHIHTDNGMTFEDSMVYWKHKLRDHFKNKRRKVINSTHVTAMKSKYGKKKAINIATNTQQSAANVWGVPHFLPERLAGMDDISIHHFTSKMKEECISETANLSFIQMGMNKTFPERRRMLVKELCSLSSLHSEYPALFNTSEMLIEFYRLTNVDVSSSAGVNLVDLSPKIMTLGVAKLTDKVTPLNMLVSSCRDEVCRLDTIAGSSILTTLLLLKEDINLVVIGENRSENIRTPHIICESYEKNDLCAILNSENYIVVVEDIEVGTTNDFCTAFIMMFCCYYVFNLAYPSKLENTLTFFQKYVIKIGDSTRMKQKVLSLVASLGAMK